MAIAPNEATPQVDLIYKIEDKPSFKDAVFAAFQHLLAIFVAIITPPLIIAGALDRGCKPKHNRRADRVRWSSYECICFCSY